MSGSSTGPPGPAQPTHSTGPSTEADASLPTNAGAFASLSCEDVGVAGGRMPSGPNLSRAKVQWGSGKAFPTSTTNNPANAPGHSARQKVVTGPG